MSELLSLRRLPARGRGVTVALRGLAGAGKSYAARQFLSSLPCRQLHLLADAPALLLLRSVPAHSKEPEWVNHVSRRLENQEVVPPPQVAAALHARLNLHVPIVLVADHLHRCTPAQLEFWVALGELVRSSRGIGLVGLTRAEAPAGWAEQTIEPLYRAESDTLVSATLNAPAPEPLLDWLYERAQGHPLYTLELLRHTQRQGSIQVLDGQVRWRKPERDSLPATLEGLVRAQVPANLSPDTWRALARLLLTQHSGPLLHTVQAELEALGLCRNGQLSHPLYRDVLTPLIPLPVLEELLEGQVLDDPLRIAQFAAIQALPDHLRKQVQAAAAKHAETLEDWETAAELWEKQGELWSAARCLTKLKTARQHAAPLLKTILEGQQPFTKAQWCELAELLARAGEPLDAWLTQVPAEWQGMVREAYCWSEIVVAGQQDMVRRWEALPEEWQARAPAEVLTYVGHAYFSHFLDLTASERLLQRAYALGDPEVQPKVLNNLGLLPLYRGDAATALPFFQQVLGHLPGLSSGRKRQTLEETALYNISMCLSRLNQPQEALNISRGLADKAYARGDLADYVDHLLRVGQFLTMLARFQEASDVLNKCYDHLRYVPNSSHRKIFSYLIPLHFDWMSDQSPVLMAHYVAELEGLMLAHPEWPWLQEYFMLAQGLVFCGQLDTAASYLERGMILARERNVKQGLRLGKWLHSVILAERGDWPAAAQALAPDGSEAKRDLLLELWAAYYRNDEASLEKLYAEVTAENNLAAVHAVQVRRQERQAAFTEVAREVQAQPFVQLLGDVQVFDAQGRAFTSRSGRTLLVWLTCARLTGEDGLNMLDTAQALFPDREEENAVRALRRLVGRVREALGPGAVLQSGEKLLPGEVQSDAELFLEAHDATLWRGPFLGNEAPDEFTDRARALLLTRLEGLTEGLLDADAPEAERLAALLCRSEPYETRLLALLLRAHDAAGHPRQAGAAYRRARDTLAEVGENLPESWQAFLFSRQHQEAAPALVALSGGPASGTVSAARQARALNVHRSTILRWQRGEVQRPGQRGRAPQLTDEALAQVREVTRQPHPQGGAWSLARIADYVHEQHGVKLSRSQLSRLLRRDAYEV